LDDIQLVTLDYLEPQLPEGAKIMLFYFGVFEVLRHIMGFEQVALKSIREPDLIDDILERLTVLAEAAIDRAMAHPAAGAVFYAEDMGFNTGLMLSPKFFRKHLIPRLKRLADAAHRHGKPFLLHSCGHVDALMEDFIETVGIDGFHSFEDNIEPVESVYARFHDRISILGGVDVDLFTNATEAEVRARVRKILDACGPGAVDTQMLRGPFPDFPADQCLSPDAIADAVYQCTRPEWQHTVGQTVYVSK